MQNPSTFRKFAALVLLCLQGLLGGPPAWAESAPSATVVVWDFDNHSVLGATTNATDSLSRALSEMLVEELIGYPGTQVLERSRLREILDEQKLGSSVLADDDARLRLGRIAGAQHMVFGSLMRIGEVTRVDVRLVSVASSQVVAAHEMGGSAQDLRATIQGVAQALAGNLLGGAVAARDTHANPVSAATLAGFDAALALMDRKDYSAALEALQKLLQADPNFLPAERQITIALEQLSRQ